MYLFIFFLNASFRSCRAFICHRDIWMHFFCSFLQDKTKAPPCGEHSHADCGMDVFYQRKAEERSFIWEKDVQRYQVPALVQSAVNQIIAAFTKMARDIRK